MNESTKALYEDVITDRWIKEVIRFASIQSHFVLFGNVYDRFAFRDGADAPLTYMTLTQYLARALHLLGFRHVVRYDRIHGMAVHDQPPYFESARTFDHLQKIRGMDQHGLDAVRQAGQSLVPTFSDVLEAVTAPRPQPRYDHVALVIDYASRVPINVQQLQPDEHAWFSLALKRSVTTRVHTSDAATDQAQFDLVVWVCEKETDLPGWLYLGNPRIRRVSVSTPNPELRRVLARHMLASMRWEDEGVREGPEGDEVRRSFASMTEGMTVHDLIAVTRLATAEGHTAEQIEDVVRFYRAGIRESTWQRLDRDTLAKAEQRLNLAVLGQTQAVRKALDVIVRAKMGLSAAHASRSSARPRGVLFFAGPTGVGKTELAKAITELVFGDPHRYVRFDMSEFSQEHAAERLLGAPPGYIGYSGGGELTNAIRARPYTLILFDEIEKAHPALFDKFLQLLDEGFMTSGQGERVYFSEAIIVFTSNLGIYQRREGGRRELVVTAETHDDYRKVETAVRTAINDFFNLDLGRPELLNRLGENIVVFDFIRPAVASQIFDKLLKNVQERVDEVHHVSVEVGVEARGKLMEVCTRDLKHGGRGIGNELEEVFINPLSRELFYRGVKPDERIVVKDIATGVDGIPAIVIGRPDG